MAPAAEADRDTLLRRLSLDFDRAPTNPGGTGRVRGRFGTDSLGARSTGCSVRLTMGSGPRRLRLDLAAAYADTHGYEKDDRRVMSPYRDWTIHALNRDLPFDRFTVDQLAGELLPNPTLDQLVATGFHRNTMINEEGGVNAEEFRVDAVVDRVNTTASVWLGTTMGCSQCHDHKFDPFSQRDLFKFFAFLNQDQADSVLISNIESRAGGRTVAVPMRENMAEFERLLKSASAAEADVHEPRSGLLPIRRIGSTKRPHPSIRRGKRCSVRGDRGRRRCPRNVTRRFDSGTRSEPEALDLHHRGQITRRHLPLLTQAHGAARTGPSSPGCRSSRKRELITEIRRKIVSQDAPVRVVRSSRPAQVAKRKGRWRGLGCPRRDRRERVGRGLGDRRGHR